MPPERSRCCASAFFHNKDGDLFVRIDMPLRILDATELKHAVDQVANASDELYPKISAWIRK